jgi:hypothetical protein
VLEQRREQAGCFMLLTNLATDGERAYSAEQVLRSYQQQYGIEQNLQRSVRRHQRTVRIH